MDGSNRWKYCESVQRINMESTSQDNYENILIALADPTRRRLLHLIAEKGQASATALSKMVIVSRQAVVKHLSILSEAELVTSNRVGREVRYTVCPDQLSSAAEWIADLAADWNKRLQWIKESAESTDKSGLT